MAPKKLKVLWWLRASKTLPTQCSYNFLILFVLMMCDSLFSLMYTLLWEIWRKKLPRIFRHTLLEITIHKNPITSNYYRTHFFFLFLNDFIQPSQWMEFVYLFFCCFKDKVKNDIKRVNNSYVFVYLENIYLARYELQ